MVGCRLKLLLPFGVHLVAVWLWQKAPVIGSSDTSPLALSLLSQGWLRFPFSPGGPIVNHDRVMFVLESNGYVSQHRGLQTFLPDHVL